VPDIELSTCAAIVVAVWLIFTALGVLVVQMSELRYGKA
jgi:hypothetical protein